MQQQITPPSPTHYKVLLASGSPRRRELLGLILPHFTIAETRNVDESHPQGMEADKVPLYLSQVKAKAYADLLADDELIVTADTVVICDGTILGKPADAADARAMLHRLSGRTHTVVTGVTLLTKTKSETFGETTTVRFAPLSDEQIESYIERYRPFDKAGAYGIQEWLGCIGIQGIDGCYYNVMGLPLHTTYNHLVQM